MRPIETERHVMVVDDDQPILESLSLLLLDEGFQVSTATNGREALTALESGLRPDLILLDVMMPIMDGWSFWRATRDLPDISDIPIIVISADHNLARQAGAAGVDTYLSKPFDIEELLSLIDNQLAG